MTKNEWRDQIKQKLSQLSSHDKERCLNEIYKSLYEQGSWQNSTYIGVTVSFGDEINTTPIIEEVWKQGKIVAVPKCDPINKQLTFYRLDKFDQLEDSYYGLKEPNPKQCTVIEKDLLDLVIVPGVVYDRLGYRVGHGGGYYDRFLTDQPFETVSLCYHFQLVDQLPAESHDIPVNTVITESEVVHIN